MHFNIFILFLVSFGCNLLSVTSEIDHSNSWRLNSHKVGLESDDVTEDVTDYATSSPMSNTSNIHPDCRAFIKEFGLRSSRFIKCSVDNARPFRFCEGCVVHYKRSKTVFQDIVDVRTMLFIYLV